MKNEQQAGHGQQRNAVLDDLADSVEDHSRTVRRPLLGNVQGVVILRVLVVLEIDLRRLAVQAVQHVVREVLGQHLAGVGLGRLQDHAGKGDGAGERHQPPDGREVDVRGRPGESLLDGVDQELQEVERDQRQQTLENGQRDGQRRPTPAAAPHQRQGRAQIQGIRQL